MGVVFASLTTHVPVHPVVVTRGDHETSSITGADVLGRRRADDNQGCHATPLGLELFEGRHDHLLLTALSVGDQGHRGGRRTVLGHDRQGIRELVGTSARTRVIEGGDEVSLSSRLYALENEVPVGMQVRQGDSGVIMSQRSTEDRRDGELSI